MHAWLAKDAVVVWQVLMTRHTVMVVGQTSGGKSVVINTLAKAQTRMDKRTTLSVVNPKVGAALTSCPIPCWNP